MSRPEARELAGRLRERSSAIEQAVLARVFAVSDPGGAADPTYAERLRGAVRTAIEYGFRAVEAGEDGAAQVPAPLLAQARLAARNGVGLDTVLRRYFAGYTLLGDFLLEEAKEDNRCSESELRDLLRIQAGIFDRLLAAVGEEYSHERNRRLSSARERRAERVKRLLAGELLDTSELVYDLDGFHTAIVVQGPGAEGAARGMVESLDRRLLLVELAPDMAAAWLGGRRSLGVEPVRARVEAAGVGGLAVGIGEPGKGVDGWRSTYRQAAAAASVALRGPQRVVGYADAALLAAAIESDLLTTSLQRLFIAPLERGRDGGEMSFATLRAYFAAERNAASAAASLGISRQAVNGRLRIIGERLGRPVSSCAAELEVAVRLRELSSCQSPAFNGQSLSIATAPAG